MAKEKKLIGLIALQRIEELAALGVPLTTIHKQLGLDKHWSYVSTGYIVRADKEGLYSVTRPAWLQKEPLIQSPPKGIVFRGLFPYGKWVVTSKFNFIKG